MDNSKLVQKASEAMSGLELMRLEAHVSRCKKQGGVAVEHVSYSMPFYDEEQRALDEADYLHDVCEEDL